MKRILFAFIFIWTSVYAQEVVSPELKTTAQLVLTAVQNNDYASLAKLQPTNTDYQELFKVYPFENEEKRKKALANVDKRKNEQLTRSASGFKMVRKNGIDAGLKWAEMTFIRVELKNQKKVGSLSKADISIFVKFYTSEYEIILDECYKLKRGWVMFGRYIGPK